MNKFMGAFIKIKINALNLISTYANVALRTSTNAKTAIFSNSHAIAKSISFHNLRSKRNVMFFEQISKYC